MTIDNYTTLSWATRVPPPAGRFFTTINVYCPSCKLGAGQTGTGCIPHLSCGMPGRSMRELLCLCCPLFCSVLYSTLPAGLCRHYRTHRRYYSGSALPHRHVSLLNAGLVVPAAYATTAPPPPPLHGYHCHLRLPRLHLHTHAH